MSRLREHAVRDRCPNWPTIADVLSEFIQIDREDDFLVSSSDARLVEKVLSTAEPALSYAELRRAGRLIRRYQTYLSSP